jgi:hypothetical protein
MDHQKELILQKLFQPWLTPDQLETKLVSSYHFLKHFSLSHLSENNRRSLVSLISSYIDICGKQNSENLVSPFFKKTLLYLVAGFSFELPGHATEQRKDPPFSRTVTENEACRFGYTTFVEESEFGI